MLRHTFVFCFNDIYVSVLFRYKLNKRQKLQKDIIIKLKGSHSPSRLNTAISPEVLSEPKWTPETSNRVSLELNCENWVYFHVNFLISALYLREVG